MSTIKLATDEDFNGKVLRALRRRLPELDIVRVQDAGKRCADDPEVLQWAASEGRVLLSVDRTTLPGFARARLASGLPMPGTFLVRPRVPFSDLLDAIVLIAECGIDGEFEGQIRYLPI